MKINAYHCEDNTIVRSTVKRAVTSLTKFQRTEVALTQEENIHGLIESIKSGKMNYNMVISDNNMEPSPIHGMTIAYLWSRTDAQIKEELERKDSLGFIADITKDQHEKIGAENYVSLLKGLLTIGEAQRKRVLYVINSTPDVAYNNVLANKIKESTVVKIAFIPKQIFSSETLKKAVIAKFFPKKPAPKMAGEEKMHIEVPAHTPIQTTTPDLSATPSTGLSTYSTPTTGASTPFSAQLTPLLSKLTFINSSSISSSSSSVFSPTFTSTATPTVRSLPFFASTSQSTSASDLDVSQTNDSSKKTVVGQIR